MRLSPAWAYPRVRFEAESCFSWDSEDAIDSSTGLSSAGHYFEGTNDLPFKASLFTP